MARNKQTVGNNKGKKKAPNAMPQPRTAASYCSGQLATIRKIIVGGKDEDEISGISLKAITNWGMAGQLRLYVATL